MWILAAFGGMLLYLIYELGSKHLVVNGAPYTPIKIKIAVAFINVIAITVIGVCGLSESGQAPWHILVSNPLTLGISLCMTISEVLYLYALRYIGLTVQEAISSIDGPMGFLGIVSVNLLSGRLSSVRSILTPLRIFPILLMVICIFLLPNIELLNKKTIHAGIDAARKNRKKVVFGILLSAIAVIFDSLCSLMATVAMEDGSLGYIDFVSAIYFADVIVGLFLLLFVIKKEHSIRELYNRNFLFACIVAAVYLFSNLVSSISLSMKAVEVNLVWMAYPAFSVIAARFILKEKYTWKHYVCLTVILLSAVVFCIQDTVLSF